MEYLVKNKKIIFFLLLFFAFIPFKAHALIYKGYEYVTEWQQYTFTKTSNGYTDIYLRDNLSFNADYIGIKFNRLDFNTQQVLNGTQTNIVCSSYIASGNGYGCNAYSTATGQQIGAINLNTTNYDFTISGKSYNSGNAGSPCWFSSEFENTMICPVQANVLKFIRIFHYSNAPSWTFSFELDRTKLLLNNDSTDIISALSGVQTQQVNTITAIEQQTQQQAQQNAYVQSSNISQAQTNTSDNITVLNDQLTSELSQFSDLTQLVVAPITMFMELNNNVCAPLTLQIPFVNQTAVLPCIKPIMSQYFGGMYSVFTTVIGAILCYWTFVKTVSLIKDLIDADNDKIEVVDL